MHFPLEPNHYDSAYLLVSQGPWKSIYLCPNIYEYGRCVTFTRGTIYPYPRYSTKLMYSRAQACGYIDANLPRGQLPFREMNHV